MAEETLITASISSINPNTLEPQDFTPADGDIIPNFEIDTSFSATSSNVEFYVYDSNNNLITADYNFTNWGVEYNDDDSISTIKLDPFKDCTNRGFNYGEVNTIYNFIDRRLDSSYTSPYFIKQISSDRTELRLENNFLTAESISSSFSEFQQEVLESTYFDEFYVCFGGNRNIIGVNGLLDTGSGEDFGVLVKLYEPLPSEFDLKTEVYVASKAGESVGYNIKFEDGIQSIDDLQFIQGPNTNLNIRNEINNSTEYKTYKDLNNTSITSSFYQLNSLLSRKGININIDYSSSFDGFVFLSSAKQRLLNFEYKVGLIESYRNDLNTLTGITGLTTESISYSESKATIDQKIETVTQNFDGYEYYLYYTSESTAWPKSNTSPPYLLYSTGSSQALTWLGSDEPTSSYYGGRIQTASIYDNDNQDNLFYSIPEFIRDDNDNVDYSLFINMMGQHFDNLWMYTQNITTKLDADNRLNYGVSKDLIGDVLKSLGTKLYSNNFAIEDLYSAVLGVTPSGSLLPPTGSELITNYITASGGPISLEDTNKEIYKRIYHNLPYLLKKKGTVEGIRNLITLYGIPDTVLRVSEFGGKDKINYNDYDYFYNRFSYRYNTLNSASVLIPWMGLSGSSELYVDWDYWVEGGEDYTVEEGVSGSGVPQTIQFRFKTPGIPPVDSGRYSQSLFVVKNPTLQGSGSDFNFGVFLTYTGSNQTSGSYSGSVVDPYNKYGDLSLVMSQSTGYVSTSLYLPFYDGGWWSVMVTQNATASRGEFWLHSANKIYEGFDGDKVGFSGSSKLSTLNQNSWTSFYSASSQVDGLYLGGYISGSQDTTGRWLHPSNSIFSGAFQEVRYSNQIISESVFKDYVMNPESIEGNGLENPSFNAINFRTALGNELEINISNSLTSENSHSYTSIHPAITASAPFLITQSFSDGTSNYLVRYYTSSLTGSYTSPQTETYYLDPPIAGIKNRSTDKIRSIYPINYGYVLSNQVSIEQNYPSSQSYVRDVNLLEVAFSPQNEINDDIIQSLGFFDIGEFIGDPRYATSSNTSYIDLDRRAQQYFRKYYKNYTIFDYVRLIKYFDNSLFKIIKDYVPARTSVSTGVVIKQHLLERNRYRPPQLTQSLHDYSGSIQVETFSGSAGGSVNKYNTSSISSSFFTVPGSVNVTQSWSESFITPSGSITTIHKIQDEFYDGEYSGSVITVDTGSLNPNTFIIESYPNLSYTLLYYTSSEASYENFTNLKTTPDEGEIYFWYDTGSYL